MNPLAVSPGQDHAPPPDCPVCGTPDSRAFARVGEQHYWRCAACEATFLDPSCRLSAADERAQYLLHENSRDDPGYRRFLARLATPLMARLDGPCNGLDYGCGPEPALADLLERAGHAVTLYDPMFRDDRAALERRYDFIACSETAEHFHEPRTEFARFDRLLKPGGWLAVMTCFQTDDARFADWHYRRDPTHVVFYRARTLETIAARHGWSCEIPVKDVALMQKPAGEDAP